MRLLPALARAALAGAAVAVLSAIAIGLLKNFTSLGESLLRDGVFDGPILYGGYGDLLLILLALAAAMGTFVVSLRSGTT